jgi:signal transduction histidine kinase/CheY-like chemotaxis protein
MAAWFPCQHPAQVRVAQSAAMLQQIRSFAAVVVCMMALGLAAQVQNGFEWTALLWQFAMGTLAYTAIATSSRISELPLNERATADRLRNLTISSALCGVCWSLGLVLWSSRAQPQLALIAVAVSMTYTVHAVAACYLVPWAVVAFSVPLFVAAIFVSVSALHAPLALIGILLIVLHGLSAFWLLRKNWSNFSQSVDMDVEKNRFAAMLQEQKEIAEKAVQLKTRFLASASHDLRQPMHAISLYLDGLAAVDLPPRIRHVISDARVCAHDMNDMFRSLLDISRLDAQQAVPTLSVFSIGSVLSRVEKEFVPLAKLRGVQLKVRPCGDHIYSDAVMVERIVLNFVSNALRHTPTGRVLVACRVRGRSLRVAIYDTGAGIAEADQQAIFDEFRRLDPSRPADDTGGLGLGLAIVRRLAQALRLSVSVRSTPGRGLMFAVDLPLVHVSRARPQAPATDSKLAGRLIVLVDDESSILMATSFILQSAGCEVISGRSGEEVMLMLAGVTRVPDVIVCDYELKNKRNGLDVIRLAREEFNCDLPALLVTGDTAGGAADKSARDMGIRVLHKPLEAAVLTSLLEELIAEKATA